MTKWRKAKPDIPQQRRTLADVDSDSVEDPATNYTGELLLWG